jgi:energy-coupling factor transporter ATP-binding protein EcfA2
VEVQRLQNPFVGLRPYESSDSLFYFGRGEQVKTLLRQLHQHRFVAVVGSSGSGKSSLIRAGLIPQLEAGFLVQERDQWLVAQMKPGQVPLGNLVGSLWEIASSLALPLSGVRESESCSVSSLIKMGRDTFLQAIREQGVQAILDLLTPQLISTDTNLFILVDQFEELFRFGLKKGKVEQRQEVEEFVALLLALSRQESLPVYVCLTMRSDFLGDCDAFYGLPEAINQSQFLVPRLTRSQRQAVITHPVHLMGVKIEPRLVDRLLNESIDTRDDLPVLQHVLMRMWSVWQATGGTVLDIAHYDQVHTIHQALNRHANEVFNELDVNQQRLAKTLFQSLTTVDMSNRRIRRSVHLADVCAVNSTTPEEMIKVINVFRGKECSFLVLSSEDVVDNPLIDISHESLISHWVLLSEWVDETMEALAVFKRLIESARLYDQGKAALYRTPDLEYALYWKNKIPNGVAGLSWALIYDVDIKEAMAFLDKSKDAKEKDDIAIKANKEFQTQLFIDKIDFLTYKVELERAKKVGVENDLLNLRRELKKINLLFYRMSILLVTIGVVIFYIFMTTSYMRELLLKAYILWESQW